MSPGIANDIDKYLRFMICMNIEVILLYHFTDSGHWYDNLFMHIMGPYVFNGERFPTTRCSHSTVWVYILFRRLLLFFGVLRAILCSRNQRKELRRNSMHFKIVNKISTISIEI